MKNGRPQPICKDSELIRGDASKVVKKLPDNKFSLIITSPPYNIGTDYEKNNRKSLEEYVKWLDDIIKDLVKKIKEDGSICWQVGNYVKDGETFPLDIYIYNILKKYHLKLRNRVVWTFNFGLNSRRRFSGRYETLLWFTRSDNYKFNLDPVRVPQLYPGKRHSRKKGKKAGEPSGNPLGKNPSDFWEFSAQSLFKDQAVWEIPNVKANHPERTGHPCQFPVELVERCVLAFTDKGDSVLDPFVGTGTSVIAALKHGRRGVGIDQSKEYLKIADRRIQQLYEGTLKIRPIGKPIHKPRLTERVARMPEEWIK